LARNPRPTRTNRGRGDGARLSVDITYYRSPDGLGPDFGMFVGTDEEGRWELQFEGDAELDRVFRSLVSSLADVATEAREAEEDQRAANRAVWLKAIGAQGWPVEEVWWDERGRASHIDFPYRPRSIRPGDLLVIYAAGTGRVVGILEVVSTWYAGGENPRWPYRMNTVVRAATVVSDGVPLDSLSAERALGKSIRQKSHVRLSEDEAERAIAAFAGVWVQT
jgi:hypothetical protein